MAGRAPTVGGDRGTWGHILNTHVDPVLDPTTGAIKQSNSVFIPVNSMAVVTGSPVFSPYLSIRSSAFQWTLSTGGTTEYYLEVNGGGSTPITLEPLEVLEDSFPLVEATVGSLSVGEWDWGDNDALGFDTVYVRLADSTDPDAKANDYVEYLDQKALPLCKLPESGDSSIGFTVVMPDGWDDLTYQIDAQLYYTGPKDTNNFAVSLGFAAIDVDNDIRDTSLTEVSCSGPTDQYTLTTQTSGWSVIGSSKGDLIRGTIKRTVSDTSDQSLYVVGVRLVLTSV